MFSIIPPISAMSCFLCVLVMQSTHVGSLQSLQNISHRFLLWVLHAGRRGPSFLLINSTTSCFFVLSAMWMEMHEEQRSTKQRLQWCSTGFGHNWQQTISRPWKVLIVVLCTANYFKYKLNRKQKIKQNTKSLNFRSPIKTNCLFRVFVKRNYRHHRQSNLMIKLRRSSW